MSLRKSGPASTSTVLRSGCGWLATVVLDSRLGAKLAATARASGAFGSRTTKLLFTATNWIRLCTRLNSTMRSSMRLPGTEIDPPKMPASPMPRASLGDRKNGLLKSSGLSSSQTLSSFCQ